MASISGVQGYWQVDLVVNENTITDTNIKNNKSSASWELWLKRTTGTSYMAGTPTINISVSGKSAYSGSQYFNVNPVDTTGVRLLSGTVDDIDHNGDGTIKNNQISFSWTGSGFTPNSVSGSGTYSTATIPRATKATDISVYVEDTVTISLDYKSPTFTHDVLMEFGSLSYYIAYNGLLVPADSPYRRITAGVSSVTLNAVPGFYNQFTGKEATGKITITTYDSSASNANIIGTSEGKLTVKCSDKCMPSLSTTDVVDINPISVSASGDERYLIAGKSTAKVSVNVDASGGTNDNNTTVTSITINGIEAKNSFVEIPNVTGNVFEVVMANSRGFTSTEYFGNGGRFISYFDPTFTGSVKRIEPTTGEVRMTFSGKYYKDIINIPNNRNNTLELTYVYRKKGSSDWVTPENPVISGWSETENGYEGTFVFPTNFDYRSQFEILVYYTDTFGARSNDPFVVVRGFPVFWWSSDTFNINGKLRVNNREVVPPEDKIKNTKTSGTTDAYSVDYINLLHAYSTEERVVGTWIDGKPLYEKTFKITSNITNNDALAHNIKNVSIIWVDNAFVQNYNSNKLSYTLPITYYGTDLGKDELSMYADDTYIVFKVQTSWGEGWSKYVTLRYTKTTD